MNFLGFISRRNFLRSLDMNLVSIKKYESILPKNEQISLFSGKVIPITNQHEGSLQADCKGVWGR